MRFLFKFPLIELPPMFLKLVAGGVLLGMLCFLIIYLTQVCRERKYMREFWAKMSSKDK